MNLLKPSRHTLLDCISIVNRVLEILIKVNAFPSLIMVERQHFQVAKSVFILQNLAAYLYYKTFQGCFKSFKTLQVQYSRLYFNS